MRNSHRWAQRGQAIAELVVVVPLLLLILIGLVELGRFGYLAVVMTNAARAAVAYGSQNLVTAADATGMKTAATTDAGIPLCSSTIAPGCMTATATNFCQCQDGSASTCGVNDCPNSHRILYVQVDTVGQLATVPSSSVLNYLNVPSTLRVGSRAVMRVSQP